MGIDHYFENDECHDWQEKVGTRMHLFKEEEWLDFFVKSDYKRFKKGDKVLCNGWGIGEKHFGGFAEYARVDGKWLIHLPNKFTLEQSMIIGAAGYTASLCVQELKKKVSPSKGEVIVTGASGGVGSIAVNLLSNLGYNVIAFSG